MRMTSAAGSSTGLILGAGNSMSPRPFMPWEVAVTSLLLSGGRAPAATGISVRPAISTIRNAFDTVRSRGTFPATAVIASIFNSGERMAKSKASASSTPGSVSMITLRDAVSGPGRSSVS